MGLVCVVLGQSKNYIRVRMGIRVYKLDKFINGLKQSRVFNKHMDAVLQEIGFTAFVEDACIYQKRDADGKLLMIIYLYVDYLLFCGPRDQVDIAKQEMCSRFPLTYCSRLA
jgi:hypothetical protein